VRVCVVGCGAIGSLFAARLAEHAEVWAYDVSAPHVEAINRHGLRVQPEGDSPLYVRARTEAGEIPPCEVGMVATKATFTEAAMAATAHVFAGGAVCSVQNGIGSEEVVARHVPRVIRGVTLLAGHVAAPGVVHEDAPGTTWLGPFEPQPAREDEIQALATMIGAVALPDSRGAQWTKLLFNAATNPLAALTGLTHGELCAQPKLRATVTALVNEGRAVADALGITLDSDPDALITRAAEENFAHKPSMLQDVLAHRRTEIDALNGGIVAAGRAVGVPTPLHATIAALIAGLEAGWNDKD
jgi:2-dehydropantoate 2-reductase